MAKPKDTFLNMVLTLLVITAIAATALGYVYELTKKPIDNAKKQKLEKAIGEVVPEFSKINEFKVKPVTGNDSLTFYEAINNDKVVGTAIKSYTDNGFSGRIWIIVGFTDDGTIINYQILEHHETPGLGSKTAFWFKDTVNTKRSIINKNPGKVKFIVSKDGGDIDAITASTISSRAFLDAVQRAYDTFMDYKSKGGNK